MSSIYVAMPSLEDNQLRFTLSDLLNNSSGKNTINIGLPIFSSMKFFNKIKKEFGMYENVKIERFDPETESGVGNGRFRAMSFYNDEDYILQIDSHTKVEKKWDEILISLYKAALEETQNDKTILTAYLGYYTVDGKERYATDPHSRYPFFIKKTFTGTYIPRWDDVSFQFVTGAGDLTFAPCTKFNANFAFSNKNFAHNTGLYREAYFFEEEICQTINLLSEGFSLIFPNTVLPLTHLYITHIKGRKAQRKQVEDISNIKDQGRETNLRYTNFILDEKNKEKIEKFKKYARVHPISGTIEERYIPEQYNR